MAPARIETEISSDRTTANPQPFKTQHKNGTASSSDRTQSPPQVASMGRRKDGKLLKIRAYPKFENLKDERLYRKQHLAAAFRIFADRGFDEGVAGHISVRDPILTDHFCELDAVYVFSSSSTDAL